MSRRKRTSSKMVIILIWSAYSAADWSANFVVGLITNSVIRTSSSIPDEKRDLLAFWAPFLLLHLGGPDTITACSLEDNELHWRSCNFFLERAPEEAFKVIEAELNLVFEVLYTKATALRCKFGYFMRFVSFSSVLVALVVFSLIEKQSKLFAEKLRDFIFYELQLKSEIADDTETAKEICSARASYCGTLPLNSVTILMKAIMLIPKISAIFLSSYPITCYIF
ncbi:unnamed protein product [Camellia sinensis]